MKKLIATIAIALFAAGAAADDVYRGLAKGSPDLQEPHADQAPQVVGVQPGMGGSATVSGRSGGANNWSTSKTPSIYGNLCGGNPDLNC